MERSQTKPIHDSDDDSDDDSDACIYVPLSLSSFFSSVLFTQTHLHPFSIHEFPPYSPSYLP